MVFRPILYIFYIQMTVYLVVLHLFCGMCSQEDEERTRKEKPGYIAGERFLAGKINKLTYLHILALFCFLELYLVDMILRH